MRPRFGSIHFVQRSLDRGIEQKWSGKRQPTRSSPSMMYWATRFILNQTRNGLPCSERTSRSSGYDNLPDMCGSCRFRLPHDESTKITTKPRRQALKLLLAEGRRIPMDKACTATIPQLVTQSLQAFRKKTWRLLAQCSTLPDFSLRSAVMTRASKRVSLHRAPRRHLRRVMMSDEQHHISGNQITPGLPET